MRHLLGLLGLSVLLASPAYADPPEKGFVGTIAYENGQEPDRFACDRLDLAQKIYDFGKDNVYLMRAKYNELAQTLGVYGEPQCSIGKYSEVKVLDRPVFLGPIKNPVGDVKLYFWAVHVDNSPKGGTASYWMLYLDTKGEHPWLQAGVGI